MKSARRQQLVASTGQFGRTGCVWKTNSLKLHRRWSGISANTTRTSEYLSFRRCCF